MHKHIPPSWVSRQAVNVHAWQNVSGCSCGMRGLRDDIHPVNPCPLCGGVVSDNYVGRWVDTPRPWWAIWRPVSGQWVMLPQSSRDTRKETLRCIQSHAQPSNPSTGVNSHTAATGQTVPARDYSTPQSVPSAKPSRGTSRPSVGAAPIDGAPVWVNPSQLPGPLLIDFPMPSDWAAMRDNPETPSDL